MNDRKRGCLFARIFLLAFVLVFISASASAVTTQCNSVTSCNNAISAASAGDTVQLNTSLTGLATTAIDFKGKDNITFNCQGNFINGTSTGSTYGIYLNKSGGGSNYNTVENCNINLFAYGVYVYNSSYNTIKNIITSNNSRGIFVYSGANASNAKNNIFINVTSKNNYDGVLFGSGANNNSVYNSTFTGNTYSGIEVNQNIGSIYANYNTFDNVTLSSNQYGLFTNGPGDYNTFNNINSYSNTYGFALGGSNNNVSNSNFSGNTYNFHIGTVRGNNISNVTIDYNHKFYYRTNISNYAFNPTTTPDLGALYCDYCYNITLEGFDLSHDYYGLYLSFVNNSVIRNLTLSSNYGGINMYQVYNSTISGINSSYNPDYFGFYFGNSGNNTLSDITLNHNKQGIYVANSINNVLDNFTIYSNVVYGIDFIGSGNILTNINMSNNTPDFFQQGSSLFYYNNTIGSSNTVGYNKKIYYNYSASNYVFDRTTAPDAGFVVCALCNNVTYKDLNLSGYSSNGLFFFNTTNSTVQNLTANSNTVGIYFSSSSNNLVSNSTTSFNNIGVFVYTGSNNNIFTNNTLSSNTVNGIKFIVNAVNNTVNNSRIENNSQAGIYFLTSNNNTIYNNIINNTLNYYFFSSDLTNYFNNTLAAGINILGGPYIGGNFWDNYSAPGTGFSATCTDANGDGICDSSYTLSGSIIDYFPLSLSQPTTCNSVSSCNAAIAAASAGNTVYLNTSLTNISTTAINFSGVSNVTLDCQGNWINGTGASNTYGIYFNSGDYNAVKNCKVSDFYYGIFVVSSNNTFTNITSNSNSQYGVYVVRSNNTLTNITANSNQRGIYVASSSGNTVSDSVLSSNVYGLSFAGTTSGSISNVTANNNSNSGVYISSVSNVSLTNVTANSNSIWGFYLNGCSNSTMINSSAISNGNDGIAIYTSSGNVFQRNNFSGNAYNLYFAGNSNGDFDNVIDTTNTIDYNKKIYYNYSISNYTFDSATAPDAGTVICAACNNVTVKDLNLSHYSFYGIWFFNTSNSTIQNVTTNFNYFGTDIKYGSNNNLTNITASSNQRGIYLISTSGNIMRNNNMSGNEGADAYNFAISESSLNNTIAPSNIVDYSYRIYYNNSISNHVFDTTTAPDAGTIICLLCDNITVENLNLSHHNQYGLDFYGTNNSRIQNVTADFNYQGIYLHLSSNNTLTNITASSSLYKGIQLNFGSNNIFQNMISNMNPSYGASFSSGSNNTIQNLTSNFNSANGLYISSISNSSFTNLTVNSNTGSGIYISGSSNNTINNSYFENNSQYGLYIQSSNNNTFYNNLFNNTVNYHNSSSGLTNYFNTTLTAGTNIIGGSHIGGNMWDNYSNPGTGFSTTCADADANGICDSQYNLTDGVSIDYLPLYVVPPTACNSVSSCNAAIAAASAGDTIQLNTSLTNISTTSINFLGKDNVTFNCAGYWINGTGASNTYGINIPSGSNYNTIENCKISDFYLGVRLVSSSSNTLTNNIITNSSSNGVYIYSSSSNTLTNNTVNSNSYGIFLSGSNNILNSNNMSNNTYNFGVDGSQNSDFNNVIDPSNIVDYNKKIYYNYSLSNYVFNPTTAPDAGTIICIACNNVTIKDLNLSHHNVAGAYLFNTTNSTVQNVTSNSNGKGISIYSSSNNTVTNNTAANSNYYGVLLQSSSSSTLTNNIFTNSSNYGMFIYSSSSSTLTNNTITSSYYDGIYLQSSSSNTLTNNIITNSGSYGIHFYSSSSNTLTNNIITNSSSNGVYIYSSSNNILNSNNMSNNTRNFNLYGSQNSDFDNTINPSNIVDYNKKIYYNYSISNYTFDMTTAPDAGTVICAACNNITVKDLNLSHHDNYGLYLFNTTNSTVQNVTSNSNNNGIYLQSSSNNTLMNNTANSNSYGVYIYSSSNYNTLTNNTANSNYNGIVLSLSSNNTATNNTITNSNNDGIILTVSSNNMIINSDITNSGLYGLMLSSSNNNTFYNNVFNNTVNYHNNSKSLTNYFNTTLTGGVNIINGNYIGGNYWGYPNGTGFSDTCTDADSNGICDSQYNLSDGRSFDYLPLYLNVSSSPAPSEGSTGGTSGGGGGAATISSSATNQSTFVISTTANVPQIININYDGLDLRKIILTTHKPVTGVVISVSLIDVLQSAFDIFSNGKIYQAFRINHTDLNDSELANVSFEFRVNKSWISQNGLNPSLTSLYRNPGGSNWTELNTTMFDSDSQYYYFNATSPGLSDYVIFVKNPECNLGDLRCSENDLQSCTLQGAWTTLKTCQYGCKYLSCVNEPASTAGSAISRILGTVKDNIGDVLYYLIFGILLLGIITIIYFTFRRPEEKNKVPWRNFNQGQQVMKR